MNMYNASLTPLSHPSCLLLTCVRLMFRLMAEDKYDLLYDDQVICCFKFVSGYESLQVNPSHRLR